jgi:hypothetical protein
MPSRSTLRHVDERSIAVNLFNRVWDMMGNPNRTPADDDTMLHAAHASRFHWGEIGEPANRARGEWQVSRVYTVLGRAEPALYHAQRCLDICQEHGIGDWDLAFAYEALARAQATAGDVDATRRYVDQARTAATDIAQQDDRDQLLKDLATIPLGG